jgi:hypothetical protein
MPNQSPELDSYKTVWAMSLYSRDGSQLDFYDYKGAPGASFSGTESSGSEALDLLNYLIGPKVTHSYDSTIAGRVA